MPDQSVAGSCLCGTIRFRVELPSLFCAHCHCTMCRRSHGAAYVTWFGVPHDRCTIETGADEIVRYASSSHGSRSFCGRCGSSLFCESSERPDEVDIVLANMEAAIDRAPQLHIYWDDRADWVAVGDDLPRLNGDVGDDPADS